MACVCECVHAWLVCVCARTRVCVCKNDYRKAEQRSINSLSRGCLERKTLEKEQEGGEEERLSDLRMDDWCCDLAALVLYLPQNQNQSLKSSI